MQKFPYASQHEGVSFWSSSEELPWRSKLQLHSKGGGLFSQHECLSTHFMQDSLNSLEKEKKNNYEADSPKEVSTEMTQANGAMRKYSNPS